MKTTKEIEDLIKAREAEKQSIITQHEAMVKQFQTLTQQNQVRVNHVEGMISQLKELLPKPAPEKAKRNRAKSTAPPSNNSRGITPKQTETNA